MESKRPRALGLVHGCSWAPRELMDGDSLCMTQNTEATLPSVERTHSCETCAFSDSYPFLHINNNVRIAKLAFSVLTPSA